MLNKQRQKAVDSNSKHILCLAGAGTGKTHCMLSRISRIVNDGISTYNMLVLTFTNAAAAEMELRYKRDHKNQLTPNFCTFHSFCYDLIIENDDIRNKIGYKDKPSVPSDSVIKNIRTNIKLKYNITLSDAKLDGNKVLKYNERFQYDLYRKQFISYLKSNNYITFDMMCYDVCKLFSDNDESILPYKDRYTYIFVDEFQDTDPKQWEFIKSFDNANIFIVGDVKQAIYAFRGADSSIIKSIAKNPEYETIKLIHNYRSTKQICDYSNKIGSYKDPDYVIDLESDIDGPEVTVRPGIQTQYQNEHLTKLLTKLKSKLNGSMTIALIARTNKEVKVIKDTLNSIGIKFNSNGDIGNYEYILRSALDEEYALMWLLSKLSIDKYTEYIRYSSLKNNRSLEGFISLYGLEPNIDYYYRKICDVKSVFKSDQLPFSKCYSILNILGIKDKIISIYQDMTDEEIVNYLVKICEETDSSNCLYVGTIHSVKGLEYDTVMLFGVQSKSFQLSNEENENLYYVGCTRAKKNLVVYMGEPSNFRG